VISDSAWFCGSARRRWRVLLGGVLLLVATAASAAPRVLILHSFGRDFGPFYFFSAELQAELLSISPRPFELVEASLEAALFEEAPEHDPLLDYLNASHAERPVDLLVSVGGPAARFVQRFRDRLLPGVPVLYAAVERRLLGPAGLPEGDLALPIALDLKGTVDALLALLPRTRELFVVIGSSPIERFWLAEIERELAPLRGRLTLSSSADLSFEEMLARAAQLGPETAILYTFLALDRTGIPYTQERALSRIAQVASAPIFGLFDYQLGKGIVGGRLLSTEELGQKTARTLVEVLAGTAMPGGPRPAVTPGTPVYDWRELERWGIREADLPAGSEIRFRRPSLWETYRRWILAGVALVIVQAILIALLVTSLVTRRRVERRLRESEERLELATADLGLWEWQVASGDVWGSDHWRRMFGFSGVETPKLDQVLARIAPADRPGVRAALEKSLAGSSEYRGEFRVDLPDGTRRWLSARGRPQPYGSTGRRVLGATVDVTEQREAQESARTLSRRLIQTQERERARVARDLHDDVTQRLARLAIDASRLEQAMPDGEPRETARGLQAGLVHLCEDVHALSYQLHPSMVDDLGVAEALRVECERLPRQGVEPPELRLRDLPPKIPSDVALCLFRVAQEALRNAVRHAGGSRVSLSLAGVDGGLQLVVQDGGPGFDPTAQGRPPTLGLASMRERVGLLGGELEVDSAPGQGTTILAWLPLGAAPS